MGWRKLASLVKYLRSHDVRDVKGAFVELYRGHLATHSLLNGSLLNVGRSWIREQLDDVIDVYFWILHRFPVVLVDADAGKGPSEGRWGQRERCEVLHDVTRMSAFTDYLYGISGRNRQHNIFNALPGLDGPVSWGKLHS
jgi:hypothetical protein